MVDDADVSRPGAPRLDVCEPHPGTDTTAVSCAALHGLVQDLVQGLLRPGPFAPPPAPVGRRSAHERQLELQVYRLQERLREAQDELRLMKAAAHRKRLYDGFELIP